MAEGKEYERYSEIIFGVLERNDQMEGMLQELSATFDLPVIVIAASYWGKFKTVSQMAMIIVLIMNLGGVFDLIGTALIWISLILTVVSLIDYIAKNVQVLTKGGM